MGNKRVVTEKCSNCDGSGRVHCCYQTCSGCNGSGIVKGWLGSSVHSACDGNGKIEHLKTCETCNGRGETERVVECQRPDPPRNRGMWGMNEDD